MDRSYTITMDTTRDPPYRKDIQEIFRAHNAKVSQVRGPGAELQAHQGGIHRP